MVLFGCEQCEIYILGAILYLPFKSVGFYFGGWLGYSLGSLFLSFVCAGLAFKDSLTLLLRDFPSGVSPINASDV